MAVTPALRRLMQDDCKFKGSLGYTVRVCLKKAKQNLKQQIHIPPTTKCHQNRAGYEH
jgi:hypothetical protein